MIQEDKDLLLKYLCMALPYGICANLPNHHLVSHKYVIHDINIQNGWTTGLLDCAGRIQFYSAKVEDIKPYLRTMSSMTDGEWNDYQKIRMTDWVHGDINGTFINAGLIVNWLLKNHFDFMGLIPKDLAIEVTKENNPYK
jgi:hypothetical protein